MRGKAGGVASHVLKVTRASTPTVPYADRVDWLVSER